MATRRSTSSSRLLVLTSSPVARRSRAMTISPRLRANLVLRRLPWEAAGDLGDVSPIEGEGLTVSARKANPSGSPSIPLFSGRPADARPAA